MQQLRLIRTTTAFACLLALTLLFFHELAFTDLILARGDTYGYFYPYWDARHAAFRLGELPLWAPELFMGVPLLANPQLGTFYPLNWPLTPLDAPNAIRISILLHVLWAGLGAYALFRRVYTDAGYWPALLAGVIFAFGGYIGAHVEQINQLQGLAWMPWLFLLLHGLLSGRPKLRWLLLLAAAWALQIFSGHTQTVFISGVGLGIFALGHSIARAEKAMSALRRSASALLLLASAALIAALLAIPQLLPALELSGLSNREGGFNVQEATAFSLPPLYMGRALLPSYDGLLFGEYVATIGVLGLGLALYGALAGRSRWRYVWLALLLIGLLFAFGRFNPLYLSLAHLPGFNFFRVPARWLALFALAASMLAGSGLHHLLDRRADWARIGIVAAVLLALMLLARFVADIPAEDMTYGSATPTGGTLMLWGAGSLVIITLLVVGGRAVARPTMPIVVLLAVSSELFAATRILPYNDLTPPDVYDGQRFTISQMRAYADRQTPPRRFLAVSGLEFDPGDKAALEARYALSGLDVQAVRNALVAVKKQEMLFPNLPLRWGLHSIDGFGGGLLPTSYYSQFTSLLLPADSLRTVDGRLGEMLARPACYGVCLPDMRYLAMMDTGYLISDKVFDVWSEGVNFDTTFVQTLAAGASVQVQKPAGFEMDTLALLYVGTAPRVMLMGAELPLVGTSDSSSTPMSGRWPLAEATDAALTFTLTATDDLTLYGQSAVDTRTGDFIVLTPRLLSSDIKIHALDAPSDMPTGRAFVAPVQNVVHLPDTWQGGEDALLHIAAGNPQTVIHGAAPTSATTANAPDADNHVQITDYSDTRIVMQVGASVPGYVVLRDAYYPGWQATVNGQPVPVQRADVMFRAVQVPAGESRVEWQFAPQLWHVALLVGGALWLLWLAVAVWFACNYSGRHSFARELALTPSISLNPPFQG
jgi:hypothetical protein